MTDSKLWGPCTWYMIHEIAFHLPQTSNHLPPDTSKNLNIFYSGLQSLLPCPSCRAHYGWTLSNYPLHQYNRTGLSMSKWTVIAHNLTNRGLKKKTYTYSDAKKMYSHNNSSKVDHKKLSDFISYILERTNTTPLETRKSVALSLNRLYPCRKCCEQIKIYESKHPISKVRTNHDMSVWAKNLRIVLQSKCN